MSLFNELGLSQPILKAIEELGFQTPTEIQSKAIPVFLQRETDLVALAQTGTGKTASFGLPILHNININQKFTQALCVAPTRELCLQIANDLKNYSKYMPGVRIVSVYGGSSIMAQIKELRQGAHIIVATPGRLIDLLDRRAVKLDQVNTVVLDEADEMLNMGFQEDMETILAQTPEDKITGLFSATMPSEIRKIANTYLKESVEVSAGKKNTASQNISHQYAVVHAKDKLAALKRIIDFHEDFFGIVFCTTRIETQEISDALIKSGYNADCLHGDLSQQQRDKVMGKFRKRLVKILCATDVAARGIDVNDITHVIHYHLPDDIENYTHRSGRTARAGKTGVSIALLHIREAYKLHQIERMAGVKFEKYMIPQGEQIISKRVQQYVAQFIEGNIENNNDIELQNEWIYPLMQLTKEELVERLIQHQLAKLNLGNSIYTDLNVNEKEKRSTPRESSGRNAYGNAGGNERRGAGRHSRGDANVRLFINLGKKDNLRYDQMREMIFQKSKVSGHNIKDIEMKGVYSFFQTDEQSAQRILDSFRGVEALGREVRIQRAEDQKEGRDYAKPRGGSGSFAKNSNKGNAPKSSKPRNKFKQTERPASHDEDLSW